LEELLQVMLEYLLDEDRDNAIYALRELADGLEEGGTLSEEQVAEVLSML